MVSARLNYRTNNGVLGTFSVDGKNQLTNAPNPDGTAIYDGNGNMVTNHTGKWLYVYDDENRLIELYRNNVSGGLDKATAFVYDGLGRLRIRREHTYNPPSFVGGDDWLLDSETRYVYDGMRVIQERAWDGTDFTPSVSYTRGTDLSGSLEGAGGIGGLLGRSHGYSSGNWSTHNYYHADGNGNVTYVVNTSQTRSASYRYDPFGNTISASELSGLGGIPNTYRFSSKMVDLVTGLYYYGHRWYTPSLQRWVNRDPIEEKGGINLYAFVESNPINEYDIDGRIMPRRTGSSCVFWDNKKNSPNLCTAAYAAIAAPVCRAFGESPWEQCQRACLQITYTTAGQSCCSKASAAIFFAATAARYAACAAACALDTGVGPPPLPPIPQF